MCQHDSSLHVAIFDAEATRSPAAHNLHAELFYSVEREDIYLPRPQRVKEAHLVNHVGRYTERVPAIFSRYDE